MYIKVVHAGSRLEFYKYAKKPVPTPAGKRLRPRTYRKRVARRPDNARRLRENFRRLVSANLTGDLPPALVTLTFYRNVSPKTAYANLQEFIRRLRGCENKCRKYIAVVEWQPRSGKVHFHVLIWGLNDHDIVSEKSLRNLQRLWLRGFADARPTDGSPKLATYMAKYLFKSVQDVRYGGERAYSASRNVLRPVSFASQDALGYLGELIDKNFVKLSEQRYTTEWLGECTKTIYDLE